MVRIHISLPEQLLAEIDTRCVHEGYNRAEFIREAIRNSIEWVNEEPVREIKKKISTSPQKIEKKIKPEEIPGVVKGVETCKHGYMIGLCKFGCEK